MKDRRDYFRQYRMNNRARINRLGREWRAQNGEREAAFRRMRYLRKKTDMSPGEFDHLNELASRFPRRQHFFYP